MAVGFLVIAFEGGNTVSGTAVCVVLGLLFAPFAIRLIPRARRASRECRAAAEWLSTWEGHEGVLVTKAIAERRKRFGG